jgi:prolyl 4-hydroxylase
MTWHVRPGAVPVDDVLVLDDYVGPEQCARAVTELEYVLWRGSEVVRSAPGGGLLTFRSDERTSRSTSQKWFSAELVAEVADLETRLECDFGPSARFLEPWQAVRYGPGGRFGLHTDGGSFAGESAGERVLTFLLYLRQPEAGGQTYFPRLDRLVEPLVGRLVVWLNLLPDGAVNPLFVHAATPVRSGSKIALTTWSRQHGVRQG